VYSEVVVADEPTFNWNVFTRTPTAVGAYGQWALSSVAQDTDTGLTTGDTTVATSTASGEATTFTAADLALASGGVKAVAVTARARNAGGAPNNLRLRTRRAGVDADSETKNVGGGLGPHQHIFENDPATGLPWTRAQAGGAATEFGIVSQP
jgi:hypothetical protein